MEVEEIGRKENCQKFERRGCGIFILLFVLFTYCFAGLLPAEHGYAVPVTLLLRECVWPSFLPLKTSNISFPNRVEEMGKQINKPRKGLSKGILSLVSE